MIKNIVFDFGGVLLHLEQEKTFQAFSELLERDFTIIPESLQDHLNQFEMGNMSNESFLWRFQKLASKNINPRDIIDAWNAMLVNIRPEIFPFLKETKEKYQTYILSNTNAIHIQYVVYKMLERDLNIRDWEKYFTKVYYSHLLHMRKPNKNIFNRVQELEELTPDETLFIDDNLDNIEAARSCGWNAVLHPQNEPIEKHLNTYITTIENK